MLGIEAFAEFVAPRPPLREKVPGLFILLGPTRCGKTSWVTRNFWKYTYMVPRQPGATWFDRVRHDDHLALFDEFKNSLTVEGLLALCDRAPIQLPKKGGFLTPKFEVIVLTSNAYRLEDLWPRHDGNGSWLTPAQRDAILERIREGDGAYVNFWNDACTARDPTVQSPAVQPVLERLERAATQVVLQGVPPDAQGGPPLGLAGAARRHTRARRLSSPYAAPAPNAGQASQAAPGVAGPSSALHASS